ncbi:MAG: phosphate acyltransferase [Frankiales bacterium]|nr:phosphate acyltransferase [Frankiales bacterium]MDX6210137.1 phosphate acyltransferase [Frankiales bacterium]
MRIAVDLLGGDHAPSAVLDGALLVAEDDPAVRLTLVGPPDQVSRLLAQRHATSLIGGPVRIHAARELVGMAEDAVRGVRRKRDSTVRAAARLVRDGAADGCVSIGATGATVAAARVTLGRVRGVSRPPLAVVVPALAHPVVLLDVGAGTDATATVMTQYCLAGAAYAKARLGLDKPRIGLLSVGTEPGKGDALRRRAGDHLASVLAARGLDYVGNVEGSDVPLGGPADVVVTDGFTGNVLLKGLEGAFGLFAGLSRQAAGHNGSQPAGFRPEQVSGALLLGVKGVVVVGHGASDGAAVAACIRLAVDAVNGGWDRAVADTFLAHPLHEHRSEHQPDDEDDLDEVLLADQPDHT